MPKTITLDGVEYELVPLISTTNEVVKEGKVGLWPRSKDEETEYKRTEEFIGYLLKPTEVTNQSQE